MNFNGSRIMVLGDVMLDHYIRGYVKRISPEAPVPVLNRKSSWSMPGGAANVARGLVSLGCCPCLAGLIGDDPAGETLTRQTLADGVEAALLKSSGRQTTCKTRILAGAHQLLRVDEETARQPDRDELIAMRVAVQNYLPGAGAVIISDYAKGVLLPAKDGACIAAYAIEQAREAGIPVLVDPKGTDWTRYAGATCVTPNTAEFKRVCEALGLLNDGMADLPNQLRRNLAEALCEHFHFEHLLLTRGSQGMILYTPDVEPVRIRAVMREVADVSGAGDTVIATLAACIATGIPWAEAARIANVAAGIAVTKIGAAQVSVAELNAALAEKRSNAKLCSWQELEDKLRLWRDQGQSIVFTNGCFDILHPGHISLLRQSAAFGDRLVVGLNSDASVRRLKGPERPIQNEESRAMLLGALEAVDAVILFDEDTPQKLIEAVKPDILVKGSDYKVEDIAGAAFVQARGGQVKLVDLVAGFSTTDIARRIQGQKRDSCC